MIRIFWSPDMAAKLNAASRAVIFLSIPVEEQNIHPASVMHMYLHTV